MTVAKARSETIAAGKANSIRSWLRAFRIHQWSKNALVLAPVALGWHLVSAKGVMSAILATVVLCGIASLTYCVNDIADIESDRAHSSKRNRPFAAGALSVRDGVIACGLGIPALIACGAAISPRVGTWLATYVAITLAYSFRLKRIPMLDTVVIGMLFTIRIILGTVAADLPPSAWLLTFSMFFFFSLATAKRHTELLKAGETSSGPILGRGYNVEDKEVTFAFGIVASVASILIVVIYLVEEVFSKSLYLHPDWLWIAPIALFLWVGRIWLLAHRGQMADDPVVFALRDRVSISLGTLMAGAFALAIL